MNLPRGSLVDQCPYCGRWIRPLNPVQSAALHGICGQLAKQRDWPRGSGQKLDVRGWKQLLIATWERAHEREAGFYPALDGAGFDVVFRRSNRLAESEGAELLQFARSWAIDNGVVLRERSVA